MASTPPATKTDFKSRFIRDFKYGSGLDRVMDADIDSAMADAMTVFNPSLFTTEDGKVAFLYASAHFLVTNVQAAGGLGTAEAGLGITNEASGVVSNQSIGGVTLGFVDPPDIVKNNPNLLQLWRTDYGRRYLGMVVPRIRGPFSAVRGPKAADAGVVPDVPFTEY